MSSPHDLNITETKMPPQLRSTQTIGQQVNAQTHLQHMSPAYPMNNSYQNLLSTDCQGYKEPGAVVSPWLNEVRKVNPIFHLDYPMLNQQLNPHLSEYYRNFILRSLPVSQGKFCTSSEASNKLSQFSSQNTQQYNFNSYEAISNSPFNFHKERPIRPGINYPYPIYTFPSTSSNITNTSEKQRSFSENLENLNDFPNISDRPTNFNFKAPRKMSASRIAIREHVDRKYLAKKHMKALNLSKEPKTLDKLPNFNCDVPISTLPEKSPISNNSCMSMETPLMYETVTYNHFRKGSIISINNKLLKVEEMQTEDFVAASEGSENLILEPSIVTKIEKITAVNVKIFFEMESTKNVTFIEETIYHPFFILNQGWASYDPILTQQIYGLNVHQLKIGDLSACFRNSQNLSSNNLTKSALPQNNILEDKKCKYEIVSSNVTIDKVRLAQTDIKSTDYSNLNKYTEELSTNNFTEFSSTIQEKKDTKISKNVRWNLDERKTNLEEQKISAVIDRDIYSEINTNQNIVKSTKLEGDKEMEEITDMLPPKIPLTKRQIFEPPSKSLKIHKPLNSCNKISENLTKSICPEALTNIYATSEGKIEKVCLDNQVKKLSLKARTLHTVENLLKNEALSSQSQNNKCENDNLNNNKNFDL